MPPATAISMSPARIAWSASMTAFKPEPQTLLTVSAAMVSGRPPRSAAWRAGFWPSPALTTFPMMHSSTACGSRPARRTASATTSAPSRVAASDFSVPRNLPVGVRTAETMTVSLTFPHRNADDGVGPEERLKPAQDDRRRTCHLAGPETACGIDEERPVDEPDRGLSLEGRADGGPPCERHLTGRERRIAEQLSECAGKRGVERPHEVGSYHLVIW